MIDVVFLLLVFFMLASRFGTDFALSLDLAGNGSDTYSGPPRVVDVLPDGLLLNGVPMELTAMLLQMKALTQAASDTIVVRPKDDVRLQRIVDVMASLEKAGYDTLVLVE